MKKVFRVKRISVIDYDEYDSCVIVADNEEEVNNLIDDRRVSYWDYGKHDRIIEEINLETCDSMELCASFNAG